MCEKKRSTLANRNACQPVLMPCDSRISYLQKPGAEISGGPQEGSDWNGSDRVKGQNGILVTVVSTCFCLNLDEQ